MKTKLRKTYNYLIRFLIIFATYGFIYLQVFRKRDLPGLFDQFIDVFSTPRFYALIAFIFLLMIVNWGTEAFKWCLLINKIERVNWFRSLKATLTGVAVSSITPNRVGDYFGRVFILEKANRIEGIFITILGSMSQLLITFITGTTGIYLLFLLRHETLMDYFNIPLNLQHYFFWGGAILVLAINILVILLFLNISVLSSLAGKAKGKLMKRLLSYIHVLSAYTTRELLTVIGLSFFRFLVFSFQLFLLFRVFGVNLPLAENMLIIAVIFFVMTMIPTVAITELGIRGSVALFLVGIYFGNPLDMPETISLGIIAASTSLWIINLVIPAFCGTIFVFNLKFFRKSRHD